MALFGKRDQLSDAPKFVVRTDTGETGVQQFGNTVFGVNESEVATTQAAGHTGWVRVTTGTGSRSGRKSYEVLVAGGIIDDATDFVGAAANSTGSADDSEFPDA
jgi:hypothetical protein